MRIALDSGWTCERDGAQPHPVTLPHDATIHEERDPTAASGPASGFYPGYAYTYRRTIEVPEEWRERHVSLFFEGVYRRSIVRLNGVVIGGRRSGHAEFSVPLVGLRYGEVNELEVVADNSRQPNTRWYSGSGLYRRVWLDVEGTTRFAPDGVRLRTISVVGETARVEVEVTVVDDTGAGADLVIELHRNGATAARGTSPVSSGAPVTIELTVPEVALWSADSPNLYELVVAATRAGVTLAEYHHRVGIRTISVDARQGLLVSGQPTLLRGGCLHHDNGVLGAATFRDAEFRRVRILKDVGFNAIRTGHTPISRDLLDACDEYGMFVMDELTDVWFKPKGMFDSSRDFRAQWRPDLESMVAKDRNHPSVILYSIGNENGETATAEGIDMARQMVSFCHDLDPTRPVTAGVNPFLNALASAGIGLLNMGGDEGADENSLTPPSLDDVPKLASSTLINVLMNTLNEKILTRPRLPRFDSSTRGVFAELDVAGYNYGSGQYELHARRHPERVMVGTETNPKDIVRNWNLVEKHPYLIGDFMWTAMDYLGEAGIGSWTYGADRVGLIKPYPWLTADCGAVDLIGNVTAAGLLARAAWGRFEPAIVSRPPQYVGMKKTVTSWRGTDAIATWSWDGFEGKGTEVLVYSAAPSVELLLNGRSLGRRPAGREHGCTALFRTPFEPGTLTAIAYDAAGNELVRTALSTAGDGVLTLNAERRELRAGEQDLAYVMISIADGDGRVIPATGLELQATVTGSATLAGFGSADPKPANGFTTGIATTFNGTALAVVRAGTEPGTATLTVSADGYGAQNVVFTVRP